jgi:hypothetical protein
MKGGHCGKTWTLLRHTLRPERAEERRRRRAGGRGGYREGRGVEGGGEGVKVAGEGGGEEYWEGGGQGDTGEDTVEGV